MPVPNLKGKTVMILGTDPTTINRIIAKDHGKLVPSLINTLKDRGASVVTGSHSANVADNVDLICEEIKQHEPKIDAAIVLHTGMEKRNSQAAAVALTEKLKETLPVIVHDYHDGKVAIQRLQRVGAKYVGLAPYDTVAHAVADAIAQHGKAGRTIGVK